jgi:hypothetical protein
LKLGAQALEDFVSNSLLKVRWLHPVVEVDDLFVKAEIVSILTTAQEDI